jgi:hypothetical protein
MILAALSKLPDDLLGIRHILPVWFSYVYLLLWALGGFLVLSLLINLAIKLLNHMKEVTAARQAIRKKVRNLSKNELKTALTKLLKQTDQDKNYRLGLHNMSSLIKMYFEIRLKKEIEEMTALEIREQIREHNELGAYFTELSHSQYRRDNPGQSDFLGHYNKAVDLVKKA